MPRLSTLLVCTIGIASFTHAQGCLPDGIVLTTQAQVNSFAQDHPGCTTIEGYLQIGAGAINDLTPLAQITAVNGYLQIGANPQLTSLAGLGNITSVGGRLGITGNAQLTDISALASVTTVGGTLEISANNNLTSLNGLQDITAVGGLLEITDSPGITSLQGLEGLVSIGEDILINENPALATMQGLSPASVGGGFSLMNNPQLMDLSAASELTSLGGVLSLIGNTSILSLQDLSGITAINGVLRVTGSSGLMSLEGLDNINSNTILNLIIVNNPGLFQCAVQSLCDHLSIAESMANISGNATGCASREEVEEACLVIGIGDHAAIGLPALEVFPNPTSGPFRVRLDDAGTVMIHVLDALGRDVSGEPVRVDGNSDHPIDLTGFGPGAYLVRVVARDGVMVGRVVVE